MRADHRARADVDVALIEDRRRREADHAALAEGAESTAPAAVRTDRPEPPRPLQGDVQRLGDHQLATIMSSAPR